MALTRDGINFANQIFIPELWSDKILLRYYAENVLNGIANMEYEGTIKGYGDTVHIPREVLVNVYDHSVDGELNWQLVNDEETTLTIDYNKVSSIRIPDEDQNRSMVDLEGMVIPAMAKAHGEAIETIVLAGAYASASQTASTLNWSTAANPTKSLAEVAAKLSAYKIPMKDRWLLLHPLQVQYLIQEQSNYAQNLGTDKGALYEGWVGYFAGFKVYQSPLVPGAGTAGNPYKSMAGHKDAISIATVMKNIRKKELSNHLGMGIVGQTLFGYKVTQPDALIYLPGQIS